METTYIQSTSTRHKIEYARPRSYQMIVCCLSVVSCLIFTVPHSREGGLRRGDFFLAPPYYSQRAVFAERFFIQKLFWVSDEGFKIASCLAPQT